MTKPPQTSKSGQFVADEDFELVLDTVVQFLESGALMWRLGRFGAIEARLDDQQVSKYFNNDAKSKKKFVRVLTTDIVPLLNAVIHGSHYLTEISRDLSPEDKSTFDRRRKVITSTLATNSLKERTIVRTTSKGPALEALRWDINIRKHDLEVGPVANIPYASIELLLSPDDASYDVGMPGPVRALFSGPRRTVVFSCHADDLKGIIKDLQVLHENLVQLQSERTHAKTER